MWSDSPRYDVAIIGGGIVGLATAMALAKHLQRTLVVLEAEKRLAAHQSGHNSGVIHSGLYYKPGSKKAKLCVEGRKALYQFCHERGIPYERCGKLVVATDKAELSLLRALEERGSANGLRGLRRLQRDELGEFEPHARGSGGLFVPDTGIVDFVQVTQAYAEIVREAGHKVRTEARVTGVHRERAGLTLETTRGRTRCRYLINCGGLNSDRIARMCGLNPDVRIIPVRGQYYELMPHRRHLVRGLVYPVPDPRFPFLGVHFTRTIHGGVEVGPNAGFAFRREGYSRWSFSPGDVLDAVLYRGFWPMAWKYWKTGLGEFHRSISKRAFVASLRRLIPAITAADLRCGGSGVRAQAVDAHGSLVDDFRIIETGRMVHVLNAPSPAATASIAIGEAIARIALARFAGG
jgi:L-2-hydroxyglutarate oxidase